MPPKKRRVDDESSEDEPESDSDPEDEDAAVPGVSAVTRETKLVLTRLSGRSHCVEQGPKCAKSTRIWSV